MASVICLCSHSVLAAEADDIIACFKANASDQIREKCIAPTLRCNEAGDAVGCLNNARETWLTLGMQYYRMADPIARARDELRAANECKVNERCLGFSFLSLGSPLERASSARDITKQMNRIDADCQAKHVASKPSAVVLCSADRIASYASFNIATVLRNLDALETELRVLSE